MAKMLGTTSVGFAPQVAGVGQMKFDAPPQYSSKRQLRVQVWLTQMEHYMCLMCHAPTNWLDVVAMSVEGTTSGWVNVTLQDVAACHKSAFCMWA